MAAKDPAQRRLVARIAAISRWTPEARAAAAERNIQQWEDVIDPDGDLDDVERRDRAVEARQAYMARLALKSLKQRRGGDD